MVEKAKINLYARFSFEAKAEQPVITLTGISDKTKWGFEQESWVCACGSMVENQAVKWLCVCSISAQGYLFLNWRIIVNVALKSGGPADLSLDEFVLNFVFSDRADLNDFDLVCSLAESRDKRLKVCVDFIDFDGPALASLLRAFRVKLSSSSWLVDPSSLVPVAELDFASPDCPALKLTDIAVEDLFDYDGHTLYLVRQV